MYTTLTYIYHYVPFTFSVFYQIQSVFGHLLDSKLQYYVPEKFWQVFKLWGQTVNIREQQDALDFYQALIDQLDEQLEVGLCSG